MLFTRTSALVLVAALSALNAPAAFAQRAKQDPKDEKYYTVGKPEIREIVDEASASPYIAFDGGGSSELGADDTNFDVNPLVVIDQVINIGQKIWTIIEKNKPVVNVDMMSASALPQGISDWRSMEGWQAPRSRAWQITYTNGYGMKVVNFTYRIIYTYGGSYNGKGRYLAQVSVIPANLDVAWGYKFDAQAEIPVVTNAGTKADPIAGAQVRIRWAVNTPVKSSQSMDAFYVQGDGLFQAMQ